MQPLDMNIFYIFQIEDMMNSTWMCSMKKIILIYAAFLLLVPAGLIIVNSCACAADNLDIGLPMYPGAKVDPANPPINAPHIKNIHIFTSDPFEKVVAWYSQKLGKFDIERQKKGTQAMWDKKSPDGVVTTVIISNIFAPAGQVEITMTKMKMNQ